MTFLITYIMWDTLSHFAIAPTRLHGGNGHIWLWHHTTNDIRSIWDYCCPLYMGSYGLYKLKADFSIENIVIIFSVQWQIITVQNSVKTRHTNCDNLQKTFLGSYHLSLQSACRAIRFWGCKSCVVNQIFCHNQLWLTAISENLAFSHHSEFKIPEIVEIL